MNRSDVLLLNRAGLMGIIMLAAFALLVNCQGNDGYKVERKLYGVTIIRFDGCEYLRFKNGAAQVWTHKGNCDNHNDPDTAQAFTEY